MDRTFNLHCLVAPGGGSNKEKFYLAVNNADISFALYGQNRPGIEGTLWKGNAQDLAKKLNQKRRKEYDDTHSSNLPVDAIEHAKRIIAAEFPGMNPVDIRIENENLVHSAGQAPRNSRPRRRGKTAHSWISNEKTAPSPRAAS